MKYLKKINKKIAIENIAKDKPVPHFCCFNKHPFLNECWLCHCKFGQYKYITYEISEENKD